jgi:hypothetical protein
VLCRSESWTLSKAHEALLGGSERKILRRIYEAIQIDTSGEDVTIRNYIVFLIMLTIKIDWDGQDML